MSITDARKMAREWTAAIAKGADPRAVVRERAEQDRQKRAEAERLEAERAARFTVRQATDKFLVAKTGTRSHYQIGRALEARLIPEFGTKAIADLTRADLETIHEAMVAEGKLRHADNTMSIIRLLLSWAKGKRFVAENVASRFTRAQKYGEGIRKRKLSAAEVKALWLILDRDDLGLSITVRRVIRLAILLGQRANEIAGMRKGELSPDLMLWTIPAARMKAKAEHVLPLPPMARAIIADALAEAEGPVIFARRGGVQMRSASLSHSMGKLQPLLGFKDANDEPAPVKMHDLRRTMATHLQHLGVGTDVIKAALAHTSSGDVTTAHYAQSTLYREVREALTKWQGTVTQMVRGHDPFAFRAEDAVEMERRLLGLDQTVAVAPVLPENVVALDTRRA